MKLLEFITVYTFARIKDEDKMTLAEMSKKYSSSFFLIPRIYCKDGFNVSVQVHHGAYCASENGIQQFGLQWKDVEWGYPSNPLTDEKYNPEDSSGESVGAYVPIEIMDELIEQHGGIDINTTLNKYL